MGSHTEWPTPSGQVYAKCAKCKNGFILRDAPSRPTPSFSHELVMQNQRETAPFDGTTFDEGRDGKRLRTQLEAVLALMQDGQWHTLREIADRVVGSEASVSARLRDLRKEKWGSHTIERRFVKDGLFSYRLTTLHSMLPSS
jgi:hypothetical protein